VKFLKYLAAVVVAAAVAGAAFSGGVVYERLNPYTVPVSGNYSGPNPGDEVNAVRAILDREALKPSSDTSMTRGAVEGVLRSLDDSYAAYFDPKNYKYFQDQTNGQFFGIGINVSVKDGQPVVVSPMKGTPAAKAGLKAEDRIVAIDGVSKKKWDIDEVVTMVRGKEGTTVKLEIQRKGTAKPLTFKIVRARIDLPNIESRMIGKDVGYVRLYTFNDESARQVADAFGNLTKRGAKGYIFDLRDNPGGLLSAAVDVTSLFVSDGVVVRVDQRNKAEEVYRVTGGAITKAPIVVLVNENSASASEIVSGALQDYARAQLVGTKSYGKGSVQTIEELQGGGAIKFTIAHYLTPKRRSIDHKGLTPDVKVPMDLKLQGEIKTDTQMQKAVEVLRGEF